MRPSLIPMSNILWAGFLVGLVIGVRNTLGSTDSAAFALGDVFGSGVACMLAFWFVTSIRRRVNKTATNAI
jgi:hypothetical protein